MGKVGRRKILTSRGPWESGSYLSRLPGPTFEVFEFIIMVAVAPFALKSKSLILTLRGETVNFRYNIQVKNDRFLLKKMPKSLQNGPGAPLGHRSEAPERH